MKKLIIVLLTIISAIPAMAQGKDKDHNFKVAKTLDVFNAIYKQLDMMYVDTIDADEVVGYAVRAMI